MLLTCWEKVKDLAKQLKKETYVLYLVSQHPRLPLYCRALAFCIMLYILSPIDLIPDFIPVLGLLDDIILVPIGIWLLLRITPREIYDECRAAAEAESQEAGSRRKAPKQWLGAIFVVTVWLLGLLWCIRIFWHWYEATAESGTQTVDQNAV